jgi:hypothetical protein
MLDPVYLFQNYMEYLAEEQQAVAEYLQRTFSDFATRSAHGPLVMKTLRKIRFPVRVFGPSDKELAARVDLRAYSCVTHFPTTKLEPRQGLSWPNCRS